MRWNHPHKENEMVKPGHYEDNLFVLEWAKGAGRPARCYVGPGVCDRSCLHAIATVR